MICPNCEVRHARFIIEDYDFDYNLEEGIILIPTKEGAEERRLVEFNKDDSEVCAECEAWEEYLRLCKES